MFSLICAWINDWANNGAAGDLRRHHAHYDVTVMYYISMPRWGNELGPSDINASVSCVIIGSWNDLTTYVFGTTPLLTPIPAYCNRPLATKISDDIKICVLAMKFSAEWRPWYQGLPVLTVRKCRRPNKGVTQQWFHYCDILMGTKKFSVKWTASRLFTQQFIQAQIKENIKTPRQWPLCREFTGDRWIPRTNGQ